MRVVPILSMYTHTYTLYKHERDIKTIARVTRARALQKIGRHLGGIFARGKLLHYYRTCDYGSRTYVCVYIYLA